jgi:hypothetical protein
VEKPPPAPAPPPAPPVDLSVPVELEGGVDEEEVSFIVGSGLV